MGMSLGELNVFINLQTDRFRDGLRDAEGAMESTAGRLGQAARTVGAGAGAALGAGLALGAAKAMEFGAMKARLNAQLGETGPMSERAGAVAGALYKDAYGQNVAETGEAVRQVMQQIGGMATASADELQSVTAQVMSLSDAFGQDLAGTTRAVDQMMRTGLAGSAQEALDILARGFQTGANEADDLLDTMTEYGTTFREVGVTGEQAMGLIQQGLQAGARDADTVADSIKEFGIRARDGSETTAAGFAAISLSAGHMGAEIAAGGDRASAALDLTLDRLRAMEDPVARDRAAVALFGSTAENLGDALYAIDPSTAVASLGQVKGAAQGLDTALRDTAGVALEQVKRGVEGFAMSLAALPGPLGIGGAAIVTYGGQALALVGPIGTMIAAQRAAAAATAVSGGTMRTSMLRTAAVTVAGWLRMGAAATAGAVRTAAAFVIAMGPVGWVIAAIVGLVALIILNWDKIVAFTQAAWDKMVGLVRGAAAWIQKHVVRGVSGAYRAVVDWLGRALAWIAALPGRIIGAVGNLGALLVNAGRSVIQGLWNGIIGMGSWLRSQIMGFIRRFVPGPVLDFLGIASPSKLFEREIGRQIPAGLAKGILGGESMVADAAARMAQATTVPEFGPMGAEAGAGGARGPMQVTFNVHNPIAERSSATGARKLRTYAEMGAF